MPGPGMGLFESAATLLFEPALAGALKSFMGEVFRPGRDDDITDESMGSFLERRLGSRQVADNLVSAVMHGIYAGDIYQLSAKSIMPFQWYLEGQYGSILKGLYKVQQDSSGTVPITQREADFIKSFQDEPALERDFLQKLRGASVFSFRNGIQTLVNRLHDNLLAKENVEIKTATEVTKLEKDEETGKIKVSWFARVRMHAPNAPRCRFIAKPTRLLKRAIWSYRPCLPKLWQRLQRPARRLPALPTSRLCLIFLRSRSWW